MQSLIAFYQDEQYWVRRARTIMNRRAIESTRHEERYLASRTTSFDDTSDPGSSRRTASLSRSRILPPISAALSDSEDEDNGNFWRPSSEQDDRMVIDGPRTRPPSPPHLLPHINAIAEPQRRRHSYSNGDRPLVSGTQILDLYANLLRSRMESCQRMARMVEIREARRRRTFSWG
ncbi:hypothetical protein EIP86_005424 [Pleurotus ostreatoroseus]|nr:hypothetical protein EIP86_005424 [Pleurotus ostreatoroseus]